MLNCSPRLAQLLPPEPLGLPLPVLLLRLLLQALNLPLPLPLPHLLRNKEIEYGN